MKKLIGKITMDPDDLHTQAADKIEELRRERDEAQAEADRLRPVAMTALSLSACAAEFDGNLAVCGEYLDALFAACEKYEAA